MADIIITIPDAVVSRVLIALKSEYSFKSTALPGETDVQFGKRQIIEFLKRTVKSAEGQTVTEAARNTSDMNVDTDIAIT